MAPAQIVLPTLSDMDLSAPESLTHSNLSKLRNEMKLNSFERELGLEGNLDLPSLTPKTFEEVDKGKNKRKKFIYTQMYNSFTEKRINKMRTHQWNSLIL